MRYATVDGKLSVTYQCQKATKVAENRGKNKTGVEDFKYLLRKDKKMIGRIEELLYMSENIRQARQLFEEKEMDQEDDTVAR